MVVSAPAHAAPHARQRYRDPPDEKLIRKAVIQARRAAGLSQADLAARHGKAKSRVAMIERRQRRIDSLQLFVMAQAFELDPLTFFASIAGRLQVQPLAA
jgi:transcriptional regulator with XRE-family HTH domain